jgi:hypothetical protein
MYSTTLLLGITSLIIASTAHAQVADRALLNVTPSVYRAAETSAPSAPVLNITGERALLGTSEHRAGSPAAAAAPSSPIDGPRALLGRWRSPIRRPTQPESSGRTQDGWS